MKIRNAQRDEQVDEEVMDMLLKEYREQERAEGVSYNSKEVTLKSVRNEQEIARRYKATKKMIAKAVKAGKLSENIVVYPIFKVISAGVWPEVGFEPGGIASFGVKYVTEDGKLDDKRFCTIDYVELKSLTDEELIKIFIKRFADEAKVRMNPVFAKPLSGGIQPILEGVGGYLEECAKRQNKTLVGLLIEELKKHYTEEYQQAKTNDEKKKVIDDAGTALAKAKTMCVIYEEVMQARRDAKDSEKEEGIKLDQKFIDLMKDERED